jgi:excisionase family DNA binding protein
MSRTYLKPFTPTIPADLVSVPEARKITGIKERTIWRMIRDGELRAWGPRRCFRISISELLRPAEPKRGR